MEDWRVRAWSRFVKRAGLDWLRSSEGREKLTWWVGGWVWGGMEGVRLGPGMGGGRAGAWGDPWKLGSEC